MSFWQGDLEEQANELKSAEELSKKALFDVSRLADEVRSAQDHAASIEKMRRTLESQVICVTNIDMVKNISVYGYISFRSINMFILL